MLTPAGRFAVARQIRAGDTDLAVESLWSVEQSTYSDVERVHLGTREPPKMLVRVGLLVGLLNWRALGPALLAASRSDGVVEFVLRDGRRLCFGVTGMRHLDSLISRLKQAGWPSIPASNRRILPA
jgi:hypothetical protein